MADVSQQPKVVPGGSIRHNLETSGLTESPADHLNSTAGTDMTQRSTQGGTLKTTHEVFNQPPVLADYNLFDRDPALQDGLDQWASSSEAEKLHEFGAAVGSSQMLARAEQANANPPGLVTHDRYGHRIDEVQFHPAYHELMAFSIENGLHASPWTEPGPDAQLRRAARYYLLAQIEAAHGCPITMTYAAIPALRHQPDLLARWGDQITARVYDPANRPMAQKRGLTVGMAMTEKQGGSDVRANTTRAFPVDDPGPGQAYELIGHKWFVSAPMSDLFLVLAQTDEGLGCFLLPRWRPDGQKNALEIQQLKKKMGNVANASSETELRGALAWMVGPPGRGIQTIIDMVSATRYDCMIGSSAGMRQALSQAIHHCRHRSAFGRPLIAQPLMQNLLSDLALESEAAMWLALRTSHAMDHQDDAHEKAFARLATPVGKYWICKRAPNHAYEAMEVVGGTGVMETHVMARLFRESPVNAIWEGSGNVQCLDILRIMDKAPEAVAAWFAEMDRAKGGNRLLDQHIAGLKSDLQKSQDWTWQARTLADRLAVGMQASLMVRFSPNASADAFCASRLAEHGVHHYGCLKPGFDADRLLDRAFPAA